MPLKHDAEGFLLGEKINLTKEELGIWAAIKKDVSDIRDAIFGNQRQNTRFLEKIAAERRTLPAVIPGIYNARREAALRRSRDALGRFLPETKPATRPSVRRAAQSDASGSTAKFPDTNVQRSATRSPRHGVNHQFSKAATPSLRRKPEIPAPSNSTESSRPLFQAASALAESATAIKGSMSGTSDIDPAIKAASEVAEIARPIGNVAKPLVKKMFGARSPEEKQERWLKRIWNVLTFQGDKESAYRKAEMKVLKEIKEKPVGGGGGSSGGLLSSIPVIGTAVKLLGAIPGVGLLGKMLRKIPGVGKLAGIAASGKLLGGLGKGGLLKGIGGLGKGALRGIGGLGKGLLKRVPLLGALFAASESAMAEGDTGLSRTEKNKAHGRSWGTAGGAMLGGALGALGGPIGIAIGSAIGGWLGGAGGELIGGKFQGWVDDLRKADIPGTIEKKWDDLVGTLKEKFGAIGDWARNKANKANEFVKEKTGIDVASTAKRAKEGATDFVSRNVIEPAAQAPAKVAKVAREKVQQGKAAVKAGAAMVGEKASQANEAIKEKTGVDLKGSAERTWGDIKGAASAAGSMVSRLLKTEGTTRVYQTSDGATETRKGGTVSWRNNNPGNLKFEYAGSADSTVKSKRTKEQALASAQKAYDGVVDLDQWGNAVFSSEDAGRAAKAKLLTKRHGDKTIEEMLPHYAISDYSGKANTGAYAAGIHKLAESRGLDLHGKKISDLNSNEFNALLDGMKKVEGFKAGTVTRTGGEPTARPAASAAPSVPAASPAPIPVPTAPTMPTVPSVAAAPSVDTMLPLTSGASGNQTANVDAQKRLAGQDVSNRKIAHIVTGGIAGV